MCTDPLVTVPSGVLVVYDLPQHLTDPFSKIEQALYPGVVIATGSIPAEWLTATGVLESFVVPSARIP
jgi:hypothetical protein